MGFFRRGDEDDPEQAQSRERIENGGIPLEAERRLRALTAEGALFTSGLSVNEFALLQRMGPQPVAQVMGASVIRTGWQYLPALPPGQIVFSSGYVGNSYNNIPAGYRNRITDASVSAVRNYTWHSAEVCELDVLTDAWNTARRRALDRLVEEALQVNADAVVGVRLHRGEHDLGAGTVEYMVTGTAVRLPGSTGQAWPTLTDLSVQDYWRLRSAGHEPSGLLATTTVIFASPPLDVRFTRLRTPQQNRELEELSRGFRVARETVRARLEGQVADAHGTGAVGVQLSHSIHRDKLALASSLQSTSRRGWQRGRLGLPYFVSGRGDAERRGWVITMHGAGTAIRPGGDPARPLIKPTIRMRST
ncbi:MAG TPA: heavy metal-binding domain-containing protein [Solirubrobacteraceae bacterium]|nr:heavy metal-binding domain-containing protein [Solirubrobacteraceae bacterium]